MKFTRRQFLHSLARVGGLGVAYHGLASMGLLLSSPAAADLAPIPETQPELGRGRKVLVLGAGPAGLCSAYLLARSGFQVRVLEASNRAGGRVFTIRKGDTFHEEGGPLQTCRFTDDSLYCELGAGRIPQHHEIVLSYCHRFGVALEPYIFMSEANLIQSDSAFGGKPLPLRQVRYSLQGEVSELLARAAKRGELDLDMTPEDLEKFYAMLKTMGDLDGEMRFKIPESVSQGYTRTGYVDNPGAGLHDGAPNPALPIDEILRSEFWKSGIFNHTEYFWQSSLLQPIGGMDRINQAFLDQTIPSHALPTGTVGHTVQDLILFNSPVTEVRNTTNGVQVRYGDGVEEEADFCVSTMAPSQLSALGRGFSKSFTDILDDVDYLAAAKVGWEMKERFWETEEGIYGGISWTKHPIKQVWYPSTGFHSSSGILTAAYNDGQAAIEMGELPLQKRFELALEGGERLHPGRYKQNVRIDTALGIAWHKMPYYIGGWPDETFEYRPETYVKLAEANPEGQVYLAGDFLSYWPGWIEGSFGAAQLSFQKIVERVRAG